MSTLRTCRLAMPVRRDEKWSHSSHQQGCRCAFPHTSCVNPMILAQPSICAVVLCQTTRTAFDRQSRCFKPLVECPACCVDRSRIFERGFCLCKNPLQHIRLALEKVPNVFGPLGLVALLTGKGKIRNTVRPTVGTWLNVLNLQGHVLLATIATLPSPLLQQVFPCLIPCQCPLLILHTSDFWILHLLGIELDQLQREGRNRTQTA